MKKAMVWLLAGATLTTAAWVGQAWGQTAADADLMADKAVFEKVCGACHGLDRPNAKTLDVDGWNKILDRMKMNGAALDGTTRPKVLAWLTAKATFDARCSQCHGTDRPLGKNKSRADWMATVQRMAAKKPGAISDADAATIAAYLAIVRPAP